LLRAAVDRGVTFLRYRRDLRPFTNEELVGKRSRRSAIACDRDEVRFSSSIPQAGLARSDSRPAHIREVAEPSLRRLKIDVIDLLYQHRVDPEVPIEDVAAPSRI